MPKKQFPLLIINVSIITLAIIFIQLYWNYKSFVDTKKSVITDLQITIDNSIDSYFNEELSNNLQKLIKASYKDDNFLSLNQYRSELELIKANKKPTPFDKNTPNKTVKNVSIGSVYFKNDSIKNTKDKGKFRTKIKRDNRVTIEKIEIKSDSMQSPIIIQATAAEPINLFDNKINYKKLITKINTSLHKKGLSSNYVLKHAISKKLSFVYDNSICKTIPIATKFDQTIAIHSKSNNINSNDRLSFYYKDLNYIVLNKLRFTITWSIILTISIIWCLIYLVKTINKQRQIATMKNDFISNISHELKTPIAIVASAIEGIQKFNTENDKSKTDKYLWISKVELQKLNTIVERILENASLENKEIQISKINSNINDIVKNCLQKHQLKTEKQLLFSSNENDVMYKIDTFHFENCIDNLIENAIKYGGDIIKIILNKNNNRISIEVKDNGIGIPKQYSERIFEKFYRIPTHNIHDVKGFGIGLYYVKQMIEKQNGTITMSSQHESTTFKILLRDE